MGVYIASKLNSRTAINNVDNNMQSAKNAAENNEVAQTSRYKVFHLILSMLNKFEDGC